MPKATANAADAPTWYGDIRHMFTATDISHMSPQGLDLTSYDSVKAHASGIYQAVATNMMPPEKPWPQEQKDTFLAWMTNNYPKGTTPISVRAQGLVQLKAAAPKKASRVRKEISTLSPDEIDKLRKAFSGIMAKDIQDVNSYFVQAGYHWLPAPLYCQHHVPAYNPWHRAYVYGFENALRSVPGCEDITLPYWDITQPFPEILKSPPFDKYTLPADIGGGFAPGYTTQRFSYAEIEQNLADMDVPGDIKRAMSSTDWEDFHGMFGDATNNAIIAAHDGGHVSIGTTMADQSVAAFDPVFWFFHANWDRLWWNWQKAMQATTVTTLLTTIDKEKDPLSYQIFTVGPLEELPPFTAIPPNLKTISIVDSVQSLDVEYADPVAPPQMKFTAKRHRAVPASAAFTVETKKVNVHVKGIDRLKIPGSFKVHLQKDGKRLATKGFFQPVDVDKCENCVENAIIHFDFRLPLSAIEGGKLSVVVEPLNKDFVGDRFPHKMMGSPTIEVQFLMQTE